jgi:hypothetical protein
MKKAKPVSLNGDAFLSMVASHANPKPMLVKVPFWGDVYVMAVHGAIQSQIDEDTRKKLQGEYAEERVIAACVCDDHGNRRFDPDNKDHLDLIKGQRLGIKNKLLSAIMLQNGNSEEDLKND